MNTKVAAMENKLGGSFKNGTYSFKSPFSGKPQSLSLTGGAGVASRVGGGARALAKSEALKSFNNRILNTVKPRARASLIKARDYLKNTEK